jgi:hypothetical protein
VPCVAAGVGLEVSVDTVVPKPRAREHGDHAQAPASAVVGRDEDRRLGGGGGRRVVALDPDGAAAAAWGSGGSRGKRRKRSSPAVGAAVTSSEGSSEGDEAQASGPEREGDDAVARVHCHATAAEGVERRQERLVAKVHRVRGFHP